MTKKQRDIALEEYLQQLWRTLRRPGLTRQERRVLRREIERLNELGRKALYDSLTAE